MRGQANVLGHKQARRRDPGHTRISRREHLCEDRKPFVRFWEVNLGEICGLRYHGTIQTAIRALARQRSHPNCFRSPTVSPTGCGYDEP